MVNILSFTFGPFQENTFVLFDETKEGVIIDPGCYGELEETGLKQAIEDEGIKLKHLLNTHCHLDHIAGNAFIHETFGLPVTMHKLDLPTFEMAPLSAQKYGVPFTKSPDPEVFIEEGDQIKFGNTTLEIYFTPGHAPGHVVFYHKEQNILIAGDTIFKRSMGRTDLPGGNQEDLIKSVKEKILTLPEKTVIFSGHGPSTSVGEEIVENPYFQ
jgi:hydroxyacylglutathione hydrolase